MSFVGVVVDGCCQIIALSFTFSSTFLECNILTCFDLSIINIKINICDTSSCDFILCLLCNLDRLCVSIVMVHGNIP